MMDVLQAIKEIAIVLFFAAFAVTVVAAAFGYLLLTGAL